MSEQRLEALEATMPDKVEVNEHISSYGNRYYTISDQSMKDWVQAADRHLKL